MTQAALLTQRINPETKSNVSPWLFSREVDLLFVSNLLWPVVTVVFALVTQMVFQTVAVSSVYFLLTMPHRWVTLGVIFADQRRFQLQRRKLVIGTVLVLLGYIGIWYSLGFAVVITARYFWNSWHVVSQHIGISRIYDIRCEPNKQIKEKYLGFVLKLFMLYASIRAVGQGMPQGERLPLAELSEMVVSRLGYLDYVMLTIPIFFLVREFRRATVKRVSRVIYVTSITLNYVMMIVFAHIGWENWAAGVALANAMIHANEYLAVTKWSVGRSSQYPQYSWVQIFTRHLGRNALILIVMMAAGAFIAEQKLYGLWLIVATFTSFLHYLYDGIIWKMPYIFRVKSNSPVATVPA